MRLRALRPLIGSYGRVLPNQVFDTDDFTAQHLMLRGYAVPFREPAIVPAARTYNLSGEPSPEVKAIPRKRDR